MDRLLRPGAARLLGLLVFTALLLSGCGGGGGGSTASTSPSSTPAPAQAYTVSGNLTGLSAGATVTLAVNGQSQTLTQNGGFTTALALPAGASYSVTVATQPADETCTVTHGSGTIASSNVNDIQVACTPNPAQTYTIGGTLTGLAPGAALVLQDNGGDDLTLTSNGTFTFATPLVNQAAYDVTVLIQPAGQTCSVTNAAGTVQAGNVTSVQVSCTTNAPPPPPAPPTYTVGGTLTGLPSGASVTLQDNGTDNLTLTSNGTFTFSQDIASGQTYAVTVATQPAQATCTVANGSGTATGEVTNVQVSCAPNAYSIGGTLSGLAAGTSVVLQDNGGDNLTLTNDGSFTFSQDIASGQAYAVTVATQPTGQTCTVTNGSGTASATVTDVQVSCAASPEYVFVTNRGNSNMSEYAVGANGTLASMTQATVATGGQPQSVAVDPTGQYVYVANSGSNSVSEYSIGTNGALTSIGTVSAGSYPYSVTVDPSGQYVYVANNGDNTVSEYSIGAGGALTSIGSVSAGSYPYSVTVDPSGQYVYVASSVSNNVSEYTIGTGGALTSIGTVSAGYGPQSVTVDPSGQYVYVANYGSNSVSEYSIGTNGALTSIGTVSAGNGPYSVTVDPSGQYVYVANSVSNNVSEYTIGTGGALTSIGTVSAGNEPQSVAVDPSGKYVYVANNGGASGGSVSEYAIGTSGTLTSIGTVSAGLASTSIAVAP